MNDNPNREMPYMSVSQQEAAKVDDMVNHPAHYSFGSVECIDGIEASMTAEAFKGYCKGAALKYLWRYESKAKPKEDLLKAQWYLNKLIEKVGM